MKELCRPTKQQQLWADCELGVIIHYSRGLLGMDRLEGISPEKAAAPARLQPKKLDTDQWLENAAAWVRSMRYLLQIKETARGSPYGSPGQIPDQ